MSDVLQIVIGVASSVIAAAILVLVRSVWRAIKALEHTVQRVERLERHDRYVRRQLRSIQGGRGA